MKWALILFTVCCSSSGDLLCARGMSKGGELKIGASTIGRAIRYILTRRLVILGGICYATAFFSLLKLLSVAQLSVAVPATALGFVVDTIGARFLLREHIPWKRWLGVLCVTAGVILTVRSGQGLKSPGGKPELAVPRAVSAQNHAQGRATAPPAAVVAH